MRFYLDTEFTEFGGDLISIALAGEDGSSWYEVLEHNNPSEWVQKNVIPYLNKRPVTKRFASLSLYQYLSKHQSKIIIADWPADIMYFCKLLETGPGEVIDTGSIVFELDYDKPKKVESTLPHNALSDAFALRDSYI